jgi:hypothetical protein
LIVGSACGTMAVVPASSQPSYEDLAALVIDLRAVIVRQQARLAGLEAQLNQSSKNSSPFTKASTK